MRRPRWRLNGCANELMLTGEQPPQRFTQVLQDVEAVGDLERRWSAARDAFGVCARAGARDYLDACMRFEPYGQRPGFTIR